MTELTYAVGDIHGRYDLLRRALDRIHKHAGSRPATLVFLGDYIDRGPASREVVELLRGLVEMEGAVCLKGNHEDLLVRCDQSRAARDFGGWLAVGGAATLASYGVERFEPSALDALPASHRRWLAALPLSYEDAGRVFVHAGLSPDKPLQTQQGEELLWIRERFLRARPEVFLERRHIVHGHTPVWAGKLDPAAPELLPHRTNLDTGAYATGVLTVGVFAQGAHAGPEELLSIR